MNDTMLVTLDVTKLPSEQFYAFSDGGIIDIGEFLDRHQPAIEALAGTNLIKRNDSFGFAMAAPTWAQPSHEEPYEFTWFAGGWGPQRDRYVANAVRKLRPLLRHLANAGSFRSTLDLRFTRDPSHFENVVDSVDADGNFPWGDFPWGGAVMVPMGDLQLIGAVSALTEIEDDYITRLLLGGLIKEMLTGDGLLPSD